MRIARSWVSGPLRGGRGVTLPASPARIDQRGDHRESCRGQSTSGIHPPAADVVVHRQRLLQRVALLAGDGDAGVGGHERVCQVDAGGRPVAVDVRDGVAAGPAAARCTTARRRTTPTPAAASVRSGKRLLDEADRGRLPVGGDAQGAQHLARVRFAFGRRDPLIAVPVDGIEGGRRDRCAGRQVDLEVDAIDRDREPRGLEVFVEAVRVRRRSAGQPRRQCRERNQQIGGCTSTCHELCAVVVGRVAVDRVDVIDDRPAAARTR